MRRNRQVRRIVLLTLALLAAAPAVAQAAQVAATDLTTPGGFFPGDIVQISVKVTNDSGFDDPPDATNGVSSALTGQRTSGATYVPESMAIDGVGMTDADDGDGAHTEPGPNVIFQLGPLTNGQTRTATWKMTIDGPPGKQVFVDIGVDGSLPAAMFRIVAAPAAITLTSGSPQSAITGTAFADPLTATVTDALGAPLQYEQVTFVAPTAAPTVDLGGGARTRTVETDSLGHATISGPIAGPGFGDYNVTATVPGLPTVLTYALTNRLGPAAALTVSGADTRSATHDTQFTPALKVLVADAGGNPVPGTVVTFTAPSSGTRGQFGAMATATAMADVNGIATAPTLTAGSQSGSFDVTASASGTSSATFHLTVAPGPPSALSTAAGTPQSTTQGTAFSVALKASVVDDAGNPVDGASVTFTAPASGASGTFANGTPTTTATTDSTGIATATTFSANSTAGAYSVVASAVGLSDASFALTNTAGPAATVSVTAHPSSLPADGASKATVDVTLADASGNPVPGDTLKVTSSDPGQSIGPVTAHGDGTYTLVVRASHTAGTPTLTVTDISVNPPVAGTVTLAQQARPLVAESTTFRIVSASYSRKRGRIRLKVEVPEPGLLQAIATHTKVHGDPARVPPSRGGDTPGLSPGHSRASWGYTTALVQSATTASLVLRPTAAQRRAARHSRLRVRQKVVYTTISGHQSHQTFLISTGTVKKKSH